MPPRRPAGFPDCVPPAWLSAIEAVSRATFGRAELSQAALIPEVVQLSTAYTRDRSAARTLREAPRTAGALAARLRFFLPRDLAKIGGPLEELRLAGALPDAVTRGELRVRVLDVGAGLGATCLGAATYLRTHGLATAGLEVDALDSDPRALGVLRALARETQGGQLAQVTVPTDVQAQTLDVTNDAALPHRRYDLIFVGFALNELFTALPRSEAIATRAAWLIGLAERLSEDGALIVLEPALRDTSRALQAVRDVLVARAEAPFVAAPCLRAGPCPMLLGDRDWCHASLALALPGQVAEVARGAGLRFEGLRYSYLVLRRQSDSRTARLRDVPGVSLRVVGDALPSKGKVEAFACGEPGLVRLMRLSREESDENAGFDHVSRGDVLSIAPLELRPVSPEDEVGIARARLTAETRVEKL